MGKDLAFATFPKLVFGHYLLDTLKNINRYIALAAGFLAFGALAYFFSNIVGYVLIAWVLSMIGQPLMDFFQQKVFKGKIKAAANLSAVIVLLIFITVATVFVWLFVPLVVEQAAQLSNVDLNSIMKALEPPMQRVHDWLDQYGISQPIKTPSEQLQDTLFSKFDPTQIANFFSDLVSIMAGLLVDIFSV
ncbi:MAG: AI-2E family transporter, partial [Saprospiraceae bacterium]|nr:AI-2E family transporter [Saprospiraceae bacterium]